MHRHMAGARSCTRRPCWPLNRERERKKNKSKKQRPDRHVLPLLNPFALFCVSTSGEPKRVPQFGCPAFFFSAASTSSAQLSRLPQGQQKHQPPTPRIVITQSYSPRTPLLLPSLLSTTSATFSTILARTSPSSSYSRPPPTNLATKQCHEETAHPMAPRTKTPARLHLKTNKPASSRKMSATFRSSGRCTWRI